MLNATFIFDKLYFSFLATTSVNHSRFKSFNGRLDWLAGLRLLDFPSCSIKVWKLLTSHKS